MTMEKMSLKTITGASTGAIIGTILGGLPGTAAGGVTGAMLGSAWGFLQPATQLPDIPNEHLDRRKIHLASAVDDEMIHTERNNK